MNQHDRELLLKAATAAGYSIADWWGDFLRLNTGPDRWSAGYAWNPFSGNGGDDALRLAVKLDIEICQADNDGPSVFAGYWTKKGRRRDLTRAYCIELLGDDPYAATRRAIIRAAAAMCDTTPTMTGVVGAPAKQPIHDEDKVEDLTGELLDAAVAKAEGLEPYFGVRDSPSWQGLLDAEPHWRDREGSIIPSYSRNWLAAGPIIERERIAIEDGSGKGLKWFAICGGIFDYGDEGIEGPTPLVAAMRAYVTEKFGETIEI